MPASTRRISRTALRQRLADLARAGAVAFAAALSAVAIANPLLHRRAASNVTRRQPSAQWSVRAIYFRAPLVRQRHPNGSGERGCRPEPGPQTAYGEAPAAEQQ